mmetsp:Transcript_34861/g.81463  ORF Transcript_34861/g.81463 Transcript_34861/m.81463 type:complete len:704 (-) Transcript_34861:6-2117(-)
MPLTRAATQNAVAGLALDGGYGDIALQGDSPVRQGSDLRGVVLAKGRKAKSLKFSESPNDLILHKGRIDPGKRRGSGQQQTVLDTGDPLSLVLEPDHDINAKPTHGILTAMTRWLDRNSMGDRITKQTERHLSYWAKKWESVRWIQNISLMLNTQWWWIVWVCGSLVLDTVIAMLVSEGIVAPEVAMPFHCVGDLFFIWEFLVNVFSTPHPHRHAWLWWNFAVLCLAVYLDWVMNLFYRVIVNGDSPEYGLWTRGPIMLLRFGRLQRLEQLVPVNTKDAVILHRSRPSRVVRRVLVKAYALLWPLLLPLLFLTFLAGLTTRSVVVTAGENVEEVIEAYFSSVPQSMATYLLVAIRANSEWASEIYYPLEDQVPGLAITFMVLVAGVDIWVMNTLLGILVEAVISAGQDDDTMVQWYLQQQKAQSDRLRTIFQRMDVNKDGCISLQELNFAYQSDPALAMHLGMGLEEMTQLFEDYDMENSGVVSIPVLLFATIMSFFHRDMEGHIEHYIIKTALNTIAESESAMAAVGHEMVTSMTGHADFKKMLSTAYAEHATLLEELEAEFTTVEQSILMFLQVMVDIDWAGPDKHIPPKAQNIATMQLRKNLSVLEAAVDDWIKASEACEVVPQSWNGLQSPVASKRAHPRINQSPQIEVVEERSDESDVPVIDMPPDKGMELGPDRSISLAVPTDKALHWEQTDTVSLL